MPSHTFATTDPEQFSADDDTAYVAVCLINRVGNSTTFQFDTTDQITGTTGGITIGGDLAYFWIPVTVRLTELYLAGAIGDVVDAICFRSSAIRRGA